MLLWLGLVGLGLLAAVCVSASSVRAAEPTARMRQVLASLPSAVLASGTNVLADLIDLGLLRQESGFVEGHMSMAAVDALDMQPWRAVDALHYASDTSWMQATGFDRRDLVALTLAGDLHNQMSVWRFRDTGEAAAAFARLPEFGFVPMPFPPDLPDTLANGPLGTMRLLQRNKANLFKGSLGFPVLVARAGQDLMVAQTPLLMHRLAGDAARATVPEAGDLGDGETRRVQFDRALRAADDVLPADALVLQTKFLSTAAGVVTDRTRNVVSEMAKLRGLLLPRYEGFVLVRVEVPGSWRGAVLSIPYADCDRARSAADALAGQWAGIGLLREARDAMLPAAAVSVSTFTRAAGEGCGALMIVKMQSAWTTLLDRNAGYGLLADTSENLPVIALVSDENAPGAAGASPAKRPGETSPAQ